MDNIKKSNIKIIENYKKHRDSLGKAKNTVKTDINAIRKLSLNIGNKSLNNATEDDLKAFFTEIKNFIMRDHYASKIICFYKWLLKIEDEERPNNMKWYKYSKTSDREKQKNPNLKASLIEPEEYEKIIQSVKMDLRMSALYETLYLSGARPNEICNMRIEDVINDKGKISLMVKDSKSIPREIPLIEKPSLLLRWLENHPYKEDKKAWLFISLDRRYKNRHIVASSVSEKFKNLVKKLKLKKTLILYSFRKTRATIMFNKGYDDKEMGLLFGWRPHTVIDRRNEYDLRGLEDLKAKVFKKAEIYKTREQLEEENNNKIENQQNQIDKLNNKLEKILWILDEKQKVIVNGKEQIKPTILRDENKKPYMMFIDKENKDIYFKDYDKIKKKLKEVKQKIN